MFVELEAQLSDLSRELMDDLNIRKNQCVTWAKLVCVYRIREAQLSRLQQRIDGRAVHHQETFSPSPAQFSAGLDF